MSEWSFCAELNSYERKEENLSWPTEFTPRTHSLIQLLTALSLFLFRTSGKLTVKQARLIQPWIQYFWRPDFEYTQCRLLMIIHLAEQIR